MQTSRLQLLKGDRRTSEFKDWSPWLEALSSIVARFDLELTDDPLSYNETASVSLLAGAAAQAGHLGIAEFSVTKTHATDRKRSAKGRCDFWMATASSTYGFEFKQMAPERMTLADWQRSMREAEDCARCLRASEADVRVGGLIVSLWNHDPDEADSATEMLTAAASRCDYAWKINGAKAASDAYLFFMIVRPDRKKNALQSVTVARKHARQEASPPIRHHGERPRSRRRAEGNQPADGPVPAKPSGRRPSAR